MFILIILFPIDKDERIIDVLLVSDFNHHKNLLMTTKKGFMKQVKLSDLNVTRYSKPLRAMKLSNHDEVVSVAEDELSNIIVVSKHGFILRYSSRDLPLYGLNAGGVKGMAVSEDDEVVQGFYAKDSDDIVMLTIRGHIIRDNVGEVPSYQRGRRGIRSVEMLKSNPHYLVSANRLSYVQQKDNVEVVLVGSEDSHLTNVNELKYQQNKFGKKVLPDVCGQGYKLLIKRSYHEDMSLDHLKNEPKNTKKVNQPIQENVKLINEEISGKK